MTIKAQKKKTAVVLLIPFNLVLMYMMSISNLWGEASRKFTAVGDFNKDSLPDLVILNEESNTVSILLGIKEEKPRTTANSDKAGIDAASSSIAKGTILMITNAGTKEVSDLIKAGPRPFLWLPPIAVGIRPSYVVVGNFRRKGLLDIAVTNAGSNNISILHNQGDGRFVLGGTYSVGKRPVGMALGDFFGKGRIDIAVGNADSNDVSILRNNGRGGFVLEATIAMGRSPSSLAAEGFRGKGPLDIAVASENARNVTILKNNGKGKFALAEVFDVKIEPRFVGAIDFNGDNLLDLEAINADFTKIAILARNPKFPGRGQSLFILLSDEYKTAGCPPPHCICRPTCGVVIGDVVAPVP